MGGRAVAKKAKRRSCVWVVVPASFARYLTSFPLTSGCGQPRHGVVELTCKVRAEVTRIFAFGHDPRRWEDHRIILIGVRHEGHGSSIGRRVFDRLGDLRPDFRI